MRTSRRIRSGRAEATTSSASSPDVAVRTDYVAGPDDVTGEEIDAPVERGGLCGRGGDVAACASPAGAGPQSSLRKARRTPCAVSPVDAESGSEQVYKAARSLRSAEVSGLGRTRTALIVDGHHWRPPCAVGTPSSLSARAISARPWPRAYWRRMRSTTERVSDGGRPALPR
jgi:hypothetical protein